MEMQILPDGSGLGGLRDLALGNRFGDNRGSREEDFFCSEV